MKRIILIVIIVLVFGFPVSYYLSYETIETVINDKERITTGSGENMESKFLVYGENQVFENTDSWLFVKFDSADVQNELKVGEVNKIKVA